MVPMHRRPSRSPRRRLRLAWRRPRPAAIPVRALARARGPRPARGLARQRRRSRWRSTWRRRRAGRRRREPRASLSWNLWIGRGRLDEVVARVRDTTDAPARGAGPGGLPGRRRVPARRRGRAARRAAGGFPPGARSRAPTSWSWPATLRLNLRYVPSMRNGAGPSDRGNAILSELPLADARAFELPLVLQRRVPLVATLALAGGPLQRGERAPRPARPAGRIVARRRRTREADGAPARPARRRPRRARRRPQPRPGPARARLAAAARRRLRDRRARRPRRPWRHTFHALPAAGARLSAAARPRRPGARRAGRAARRAPARPRRRPCSAPIIIRCWRASSCTARGTPA